MSDSQFDDAKEQESSINWQETESFVSAIIL